MYGNADSYQQMMDPESSQATGEHVSGTSDTEEIGDRGTGIRNLVNANAMDLCRLTLLSLLQVCLILSLIEAQILSSKLLSSSNDKTPGERHSENYYAMYDICGKRSDCKVVNCPYSSPAVKPDDLLSSKIQSLCPTITGDVCCTEAQFETLRQQVSSTGKGCDGLNAEGMEYEMLR